ncbi:probable 4-coumarate--CoA ligase 1 [Aricia agestis]|uniref:probable 4-coumarate--CoA ligase 1 n=1 Tax=Aricia agestis TaxID=91739 RepID=UPI001C207298|nr:probable 4-coumarate--CoA ligase 1 [Aricia agestis]
MILIYRITENHFNLSRSTANKIGDQYSCEMCHFGRVRAKTKLDANSCGGNTAQTPRSKRSNFKMSSLKIFRGSLARNFLNNNFKHECKSANQRVPKSQHFRRCYATQPVSVLEPNVLSSPWGEITIGQENLHDHIFQDVQMWPDAPCVTCGTSGRSYEYGMMMLMVDRCAQALIGHVGLDPGDRVGLILPNIPEFVVVCHGALKAGLVVTFANPLYTADELRRQFTDCGVKLIATIEMFMPVAKEVAKSLKDYKGTIFIGGEDDKTQGVYGLRSLLLADHKADLTKVSGDDLAIIPYSSGTTGLPKGVMLTHKNLVCNIKQVQAPKVMKYEGEKGKGDVVLTVPPFFHIYGFNGILNYNLILGYHVVSIPKFTPEEYIKALVEYKPSTLFVVPSLLAFLATHPMVKKEHLQSVETIMVGGAPTTDAMFERFLLKVEKTKNQIQLLQGYGMTESSPVTLMTPFIYPHSKVGSVGQLVMSTQGRIMSLSTGQALPPHQSGELLLRGPQLMKGYWNNEKATKETIDSEGWLHTGDVAYYDEDHYFYVVDRTKELIKVKGNQVSPTEIEGIIMELPEVADAAVVGIPDPLAGEIPRAFVVLKPNQKLTERQIYDVVAQKLTKYKRLEGGVVFLEIIPRNAAGKILRNELKVLGKKGL